jgi:hypothetical protein
MNPKLPITKEYFIKRLTELCLKGGLPGLPKDEIDLHIVLKSAALMVGQTGIFTEKEVNDRLELWVLHTGQAENMDHVTLRRGLVDAGYLTRDKDGTRYQVAIPGPKPEFFSQDIEQLDIPQVIETAREEIARRKREYLAKARGG